MIGPKPRKPIISTKKQRKPIISIILRPLIGTRTIKTHLGFDPQMMGFFRFFVGHLAHQELKARGEGDYRISSLLLPNAEVSAEWPGLVVIIVIIGVIVVIVVVIIVCFPLPRGCLGQCCVAQERFYFQR